MNRQFIFPVGTRLIASLRGEPYEARRAREIAPLLAQADFVLDIHSTLKPSVPFVYLKNTPRHLRLASVLQTKYIVSSDPVLQKSDLEKCIDRFVDEQGGIGMTYESGWHQEKNQEQHVLQKVQHFLKATGVAFHSLEVPSVHQSTHLVVYKQLRANTDRFRFTSDFINFDRLKKGERLAKDGDQPVIVDRNSFLLFPKKEIQKSGIACYLATPF